MNRFFTLYLLYLLSFLSFSFSVFAAPPTVPSSNLGFNTIDGGFFNLGWTPGNGARRIMVAKAGGEPTFVPTNGVDYDANTTFGSGQQVAPGEFIVYDHFSTSFFLVGLTPATQYFFRVFEYNGTGTETEYLTTSYLSGSGSTSATPTIQTSNAGFSNITANSVIINWTNGNGLRRLIVAKEGAPVSAEPDNSETYSGASTAFGNGTSLGNGNYAVYRSNGTNTSVTSLKPGTTYHLAFFEFNGNQQPQFLKPGYTASFTTRSGPTIPPSGISIAKADGKELSLNWTNGNGQRRVVIARQGSAVTAVPVNGTDYNANATFGLGQQIAPGEYVVYDDNFNGATVSGLAPATAYHFRVFEYDGTGSNTIYLTSDFAALSGSTVSAPTVQSGPQPATNITASSLRLNFTQGNGRARLVIGRSGSPVNAAPADFTVYTESSNFGSGHHLGNGNYVLGYTTAQTMLIQNLQPGTTYHFAVFELNGFNQPLYLTPAATLSATTTGTLPVKLISWEATDADNKVNLQWKTGTEVNTSHFVVERSGDGREFSPLSKVMAKGNSSAEVTYSAVDHQPLSGKSYYRLKMVDKDEKSEYSAIRTIAFGGGTARLLQNPVRSNLQVLSSANNRTEWKIVNVTGQIMGKGILIQGQNDINVSALPPGRYWLRLDEQVQAAAIPFLKQ